MNLQRFLPGCLVNDSVSFTSQTTHRLTECSSLFCIPTASNVLATNSSFVPLKLASVALSVTASVGGGSLLATPLSELAESSSLASTPNLRSFYHGFDPSRVDETTDFLPHVATTTTSSIFI